MKIFNKKMLIISVVLLAACSKYQQLFGGKSSDYEHANTTSSLQFPNSKSSLPTSERYNIPAIQTTEQALEITPPDYRD